jgi:hypothetical protein
VCDRHCINKQLCQDLFLLNVELQLNSHVVKRKISYILLEAATISCLRVRVRHYYTLMNSRLMFLFCVLITSPFLFRRIFDG